MPEPARVLVFMEAVEAALATTEVAEMTLATMEAAEAAHATTEVAEVALVITTVVVGVVLVIMVVAGVAPAGFGSSESNSGREVSESIWRIYWKKIPIYFPLME